MDGDIDIECTEDEDVIMRGEEDIGELDIAVKLEAGV